MSDLVEAHWNGVALTSPATRTARTLRLEARLAAGDWTVYTYDINGGDGSDTLTIAAGDTSVTTEVRGVTFYDYAETPHYGAYPLGTDWPQSALLGAFGRVYQGRLAPDETDEFAGTGYDVLTSPPLTVYMTYPLPPATPARGGARVRFLPVR